MSDKPMLFFRFDKTAELEVADRASRLTPVSEPPQLNEVERAIHFLRGVGSRASMALPAFYLFHGTNANAGQTGLITGYAGQVFRLGVQFSSLGTISLCCRKAFDHAANGLTGANFARTSDDALLTVAEHWSTWSSRPHEDAVSALRFLRLVFRTYAKTSTSTGLFHSGSTSLGRRIGLLKQYADRSAAHLSMQDYSISTLDCSHVVSVLAIIGEIIRSFDDPTSQSDYFDKLDEASLCAARQLFPATPEIRLFEGMEVEMQARLYWQWGAERGLQSLENVAYATGWY
jgi:hypothetical protein